MSQGDGVTNEANQPEAAGQATGDAQPASPAGPAHIANPANPANPPALPSFSPPAAASSSASSAAPFSSRDPGDASFWDERFEQGVTPWDSARVPDAFAAFAARHARVPVLIPGCGSAYEARWLARAGWLVRAIDFSAQAVAAARRELGEDAGLVEQADFFTYAPPFVPQWIYERAFLCAIPRSRRADYARRMAELLPPGGFLAGFFFIGATPKGPPFGIERAELDALLCPHFALVEDEPVADSLPVFAGRERWLAWRRS
ncbi:thiopurine S-methyltransferase [Burkholderia pseudomallei]|uniref:methyltransferase domain-containing protein n=1 Tax=Burkholderia pseudomallei TaxID=28450 RepID=UPI0000559D78|nr:methyltransferase domain-containing protein [Burkholderia pseudomallei]ACQ99087.1 thiopurine S-methyltransferase family protein [Burkholderia pseudomallei MSHR346]AIP03196.1 thiopurine S-methyltransferase family protein [Burkholderia pseudomallei]AIP11261.1 thiopurine S-methyltransferase family protein [Burkholderia pseudomallei]AIP59662.1 thiopurine S-methyltransferase family protein [Burkholderia pseudomallei HBPUB10303a]AIP69810.1 thiopurine S-methyltransferase family protein [Burkholder